MRPVASVNEVSVVIPCLDEEASIAGCVHDAHAALQAAGLVGEVVVVDNGSTDRSAERAREAGARVVSESRRGYGSAYLAGFAASDGTLIVMGDGDGTYDFAEIPAFVARLRDGADLVVGDRMDNIDPGAMPWLHRRVGNPALSRMLNAFFDTGVRDAHCGMRAVRRDALDRLGLQTLGMEFASEMVVRAGRGGLVIAELPITYRARVGESKLSRYRDGWRHLRFLLLHSPTHLFVLPGAVAALLGALIQMISIAQLDVLGRQWQLHTMIAGSLLTIVGAQVVTLGICARVYAANHLGDRDRLFEALRTRIRMEHGLVIGGVLTTSGLVIAAVIVGRWVAAGAGELDEERTAVGAATLIVIGAQVFFGSFLISVLGLRRTGDRTRSCAEV